VRKLERFDIMDPLLYEEKRAELKRHIVKIKEPRRVFLGDKLLFIFENTEMVRDHIQEKIRTDKIFREHDVLRQLEIFNPLIADAGELRCTMIVLSNADWERPHKIRPWKDLVSHIYFILDDGRKVYAQAAELAVINQHPGTLRVLTFFCGTQFPVIIGSDFKEYKIEKKLTVSQQKALQEDLHSIIKVAAEKHLSADM